MSPACILSGAFTTAVDAEFAASFATCLTEGLCQCEALLGEQEEPSAQLCLLGDRCCGANEEPICFGSRFAVLSAQAQPLRAAGQRVACVDKCSAVAKPGEVESGRPAWLRSAMHAVNLAQARLALPARHLSRKDSKETTRAFAAEATQGSGGRQGQRRRWPTRPRASPPLSHRKRNSTVRKMLRRSLSVCARLQASHRRQQPGLDLGRLG